MWPQDEIFERLNASGYQSLTEVERSYFALFMMRADVCNGGFHQYFYNYTGDYANDAIRMLGLIGNALREVHEVLERAMAVLPKPYATDNTKRRHQIVALNNKACAEWESLERTVFDFSTDIEVELEEWAAENASLFPE